MGEGCVHHLPSSSRGIPLPQENRDASILAKTRWVGYGVDTAVLTHEDVIAASNRGKSAARGVCSLLV